MLLNRGPEKTLDGPLNSKEIEPVKPKGNQPWIFTGRTDAEASILWLLDVKSRLIGKQPDAGKDWVQEKRVIEDNMVGWHPNQWYKFAQTPTDREGQGNLACCSQWGHKESNNNQWLTQQKYSLKCFLLQSISLSFFFFFDLYITTISLLSLSLMSFTMTFTYFSFYNCTWQRVQMWAQTPLENP